MSIVYSKTSRMIKSGVFQEKKIDYNPVRSERKFAGVTYSVKGIVIRSDVRAADPRLTKKSNLKPCVVIAKNFWTEEGFPKFKYVTGEEAYRVIADLCGEEYIK